MTPPMSTTWQATIDWSRPHSIAELTAGRGARLVIPKDRGYYAFVEGAREPAPDRVLYLGIAARQTLYRRLGGYLRKSVTETKAANIRHRGKRLLAFARIKGLDGKGPASGNTPANDGFIHVCWATSPILMEGPEREGGLEAGYRLERALVDYFRPLYNTADWDRDNDFDLEDPVDWE